MNVGLSLDGCRKRQKRFLQILAAEKLDSAFISDPRHIYYFSGYWRVGRVFTPAALLIRADGRSILGCPASPPQNLAVDEICTYKADRIGTLIDDPTSELLRALDPHLTAAGALGTDVVSAYSSNTRTLLPAILSLRRTKDSDELMMVKAGIAGCDAAYTRAKELLNSRVTEVELYAMMRAAATGTLGEPLTDFGNDFQCGALGSIPRDRKVEAGETAILDLGVVYRGYSSDLCRTFVVGAQPTEVQMAAYERIMEAMRYVEDSIRPGVSCRAVYDEVFAMLDGFRGWKFPHHLGHGIGLSAHEAPRLNPHWDDTFQVGDVFTAEPGLYGEELRAGIRIENDYIVTPDGVERLSHFPTELA